MNSTRKLLFLVAAIALTGGCDDKDAVLRLKARTDIDLVCTNVAVSFVRHADLDRLGYQISVPEKSKDAFQRAFEKAAGRECWQLVVDQGGCHYNSKAGHDIFVERSGPGNYSILTSG
jgi:hypothetical protein